MAAFLRKRALRRGVVVEPELAHGRLVKRERRRIVECSAHVFIGSRSRGAADAGGQFARRGNQLAPVVDCIFERIEAANQEGRHAEFVIL